MKSKILKVSIILLLIITMTMVNFVYLGKTFISYAIDDLSTNTKNIEFGAYFKDATGQKVTQLQPETREANLILEIAVKQEGYFNGQIDLQDTNFKWKELVGDNPFVNKIEGNTITLNQINAGSTAQIEMKVELIKDEILDSNLLEKESTLQLKGIYKDSSEKDISVVADKTVKLSYPATNIKEGNIINEMEVMTNKTMTIQGEERKVVQVAFRLGLKENNNPIASIEVENKAPVTQNGSLLDVSQTVHTNMITSWKSNTKSNAEGTVTTMELTNTAQDGKILWKEQGKEEIIFTYIAKAGTTIDSQDITAKATIKFYDGQEITLDAKTTLDASVELSNIYTTKVQNKEQQIYKGKLYQGLDREFETDTTVYVDLANASEYLEIKDENSFGIDGQNLEQATPANVIYLSTVLNKEQWMKILGENGTVTVLDKNGKTIATIDKNTTADEQGNIVLDYGQGLENVILKTSTPVDTGKLELTHHKVLKNNTNIDLKQTSYFMTVGYITDNLITDKKIEKENQNVAIVELKEPKTEASLQINKSSLATAVTNELEMKVVLKTNSEAYDLYQNPTITIALPEDVETIDLRKVELLYEEELKIKAYHVEGKNIIVELEGQQTAYKEQTVEGANIFIYANVTLNEKAATKDAQVVMSYTNQKASQAIENVVMPIKIEAPTEITAIYQIPELGVETIGQEETKTVSLPIGAEATQITSYIEIVNNKSATIHDVSILGVFPTASAENNMDTSIIKGIEIQGIDHATVYYTENENATIDLNNAENGWSQTIADATKVKRYLIVIDEMETQARMSATYQTQIPANLEYNKNAKQWYEVSYTDSQTMTQNKVLSTQIEMTTGVGPRVEVAMTGKVGSEMIQNDATVMAGEVIKYQVEVSNTGSEPVTDAKITANIPEGTVYVKPKENYEYTGASYYQETDQRTYEETIESIQPGEKVSREFEVRVNKDIEDGKQIKEEAQVTVGEVTKQTNTLQYITQSGTMRVSVKRVTDRSTALYAGGVVQYFAIIENTSQNAIENVQIQTKLPEGVSVERLQLMTGMEDKDITDDQLHSAVETVNSNKEIEITEDMLLENGTEEEKLQTETLTYADTVSIGTLQPGEIKVLSYDIAIQKENTTNHQLPFSVVAIQDSKQYRSNEWIDEINHLDIGLEMTSNITDTYIKAGDSLVYTIKIKNNSPVKTQGLVISDEIPKELTIEKIIKDGEEMNLPESNSIQIDVTVEPSQESMIQIQTVVDYEETQEEPVSITNHAEAMVYGETVATTSELTHIIEPVTGQDNDNNNNNNNDVPDNNTATGNRIISGVAWYDENGNGMKEDNETLLSGIVVKLLNVETNQFVKDKEGNVLQASTDEKGIYTLNHIGNGKYVVIFEYDTAKYALTKYQVEGSNDTNNSKVMMNTLTVDGTEQQVASTDIVEINNSNIANINVGFIPLKNFDLKLDKYVSKVMIQNSQGTTVKEYQDETMAKVELDGKVLNGTTVIIEYQIKVSNVGEIPGYAKSIADYIPNDLSFSSEMNKDWYLAGENTLYNTSLANTKIEAGETKTITLTLTKTMTENNTGLVNNTAEIADSYNELGLADSNSTQANKVQGENDMGVADVIISIKTGEIILYSSLIGFVIVVLGATVIVLQNKKMKVEQNKRKIDKIS